MNAVIFWCHFEINVVKSNTQFIFNKVQQRFQFVTSVMRTNFLGKSNWNVNWMHSICNYWKWIPKCPVQISAYLFSFIDCDSDENPPLYFIWLERNEMNEVQGNPVGESTSCSVLFSARKKSLISFPSGKRMLFISPLAFTSVSLIHQTVCDFQTLSSKHTRHTQRMALLQFCTSLVSVYESFG